MKILHAIHDFLPAHRAGSEIYAFELCRALARRHEVSLVCAEYDRSRAHGSIEWRDVDGLPVAEIINNWKTRTFGGTYAARTINRSLKRVLDRCAPDVLHIHNLLNLSFDLPALARDKGIPSVATLHDYTLVCASGGQRVHMADEHVCTEIDPERCARCFGESPFSRQISRWDVPAPVRQSPAFVRLTQMMERRTPETLHALKQRSAPRMAVTAADITQRLADARRVFDLVDLFVAPSAALGAEYRRLGLPAGKLVVSDYGFVPLEAPRLSPGGRIRIGFVGTLVWHKGAHVLIDAVRGLPPDAFEVKLYGNTVHFPEYVRDLRVRANGLPVQFMGGFDQSRTGEVYGAIDVLVVPSLWPENSPLVIHEAFMAGVPVIGARQGGIPELVSHGQHGFIYDAYSADDLRTALARILDEPGLLQQFARQLPAVKSIDQDADEWEERYRALAARKGRTSVA